jgi:hypothetical protein
MLRFIRVQNLAVIESVEVEFDAGFNVLTGETGGREVESSSKPSASCSVPAPPWTSYGPGRSKR